MAQPASAPPQFPEVSAPAPNSSPDVVVEFDRLVKAGEASAKAGKHAEAIEQFSKALALRPPERIEAAVLTFRAGALTRINRFEEAIRDLDRAVTLSPQRVCALGSRRNTAGRRAISKSTARLRRSSENGPG